VNATADGPSERFINRVGFVNTAPQLVITVVDEGPGMNGEQMAKIFEERFTTKEAGRGTGLGLSIVRRLVAEAKGGIHVRTEQGKGTEFTVFIHAKR
jgi:signal transduction histidine kinase